jgi:uncharacterized protein
MKTRSFRCLLVCAALFGAASFVQAQSLGDIRARMEKRVSQVDALKSKGVLGENNRGFLEVRSGDDGGVAAAENADRTAVYAALAQKTGASAAAVGQARAKQIYGASAKGVWVQAPGGEWLKK